MRMDLKSIAELVGGDVVGNENLVITGLAGIEQADDGDLTFLIDSRHDSMIETTRASAVIVSRGIQNGDRTLIYADDPYLAFSKVAREFFKGEERMCWDGLREIHPTAHMGTGVKLGHNVSIQAYVVVEDDAEIGDGVILHPYVAIGQRTNVGAGTVIFPHVTVRENVTIGRRVVIHSGSVIGSDGFGFAQVKGGHHKVPQTGTVRIEDEVEIGSNVTIDRATIGTTLIEQGARIGNLVQVAHNVVVGENCLIGPQTGISGSTTVRSGVSTGNQVGIAGHIEIGENTSIGFGAGVTKALGSNLRVAGFPARALVEEESIRASMLQLPDVIRSIRKLEGKLELLENSYPADTEENRDTSVVEAHPR